MQTKRTYSLFETLRWSKNYVFGPAVYATVVVCCYKYLWIGLSEMLDESPSPIEPVHHLLF